MTTTPLDILLIESHPGIGSLAVADLTASGHRLHRCHDRADRGFGCRGLHDPSACPLDGHVDVAFVAREGSYPSTLEDGVRCAIRARVPLVEDGLEASDPYAPWVTERVSPGADVDAACRRAVEQRDDGLAECIHERLAGLLAVACVRPAEVRYQLEAHGTRLDVTVILPTEVTRRTRESMAVRVLDAIRSDGRTFGRVDVSVTSCAPPG